MFQNHTFISRNWETGKPRGRGVPTAQTACPLLLPPSPFPFCPHPLLENNNRNPKKSSPSFEHPLTRQATAWHCARHFQTYCLKLICTTASVIGRLGLRKYGIGWSRLRKLSLGVFNPLMDQRLSIPPVLFQLHFMKDTEMEFREGGWCLEVPTAMKNRNENGLSQI